MKEIDVIDRALSHIKEMIGIDLNTDGYFVGLQAHNNTVYFNVELEKPCFDSGAYTKLINICGNDRIVKNVEPNGYKRLALFLNSRYV